MKRFVLTAALTWVGLALVGHVNERRGRLTCECSGDCWCKRPPLSLFRWVLPLGHRFRHEDT
ncbi:MAG: hypothetical protein M3N53_00230 [Actinomycetota bacterium]|nr:hypothetical protein [Actinomycetota bacterium]